MEGGAAQSHSETSSLKDQISIPDLCVLGALCAKFYGDLLEAFSLLEF